MEKMSPAGPRIPTPRQPSRGDDGGGFRGGGVPRWSEARSDGGAGENLGLAAFGFGRKMDDGSGHKPGSQPDSFYYFGDASTSSVKAQKRRWWWDLNPTAPSFLQPPSTLLPKAAPKLFGTRRTHNRLQPHALKSADSAYYGVRRPEAIPAPQGTLQAPRTERKARRGVARLTRH
jgi:hypothetical protein